jgi:hypothetical protein
MSSRNVKEASLLQQLINFHFKLQFLVQGRKRCYCSDCADRYVDTLNLKKPGRNLGLLLFLETPVDGKMPVHKNQLSTMLILLTQLGLSVQILRPTLDGVQGPNS